MEPHTLRDCHMVGPSSIPLGFVLPANREMTITTSQSRHFDASTNVVGWLVASVEDLTSALASGLALPHVHRQALRAPRLSRQVQATRVDH